MRDKRVKILFISTSLERRGGIAAYVNALLENMPKDRFSAAHFQVGRSDTKGYNLFLPLTLGKQLFRFYRLLKREPPDIIHINASMDRVGLARSWPYIIMAKKCGIPTVFCLGGWKIFITKHFKGPLSSLFKKGLMLPNKLMVLAKTFQAELLELGIPSHKVALYNMMVDIADFTPTQSKKDAGVPCVLFCSRIEKTKGVYELLDAVPLVLRNVPQARFIYMGDGKELPKLKDLAEKRGLTDNVKFLGHLSGKDKIEVYLSADIFVLPSYTEGFPNVICEALAAGLPIVATRVGAIEEVIQSGKNGFLLGQLPPSSEEIADNINRLISDNELSREIAHNNLLAARRYDSQRVAREVGIELCRIIGY